MNFRTHPGQMRVKVHLGCRKPKEAKTQLESLIRFILSVSAVQNILDLRSGFLFSINCSHHYLTDSHFKSSSVIRRISGAIFFRSFFSICLKTG